MNNKASWVAVVAFGLFAWALTANVNQAQTAVTSTNGAWVGVVDLVRVFNDFEQTKALNAELDRYKSGIASEQQSREEKLSVERQTLQGFAPDSAEYKQRSKAFKKMMIDYQAWLTVEREVLKEEHFRWIERTYRTITDAIAQVAQSKGVQVVLTREELDTSVADATVLQKQILNRKVIYYDQTLDLTDTVLTVINDAFSRAGGAKTIKIGS